MSRTLLIVVSIILFIASAGASFGLSGGSSGTSGTPLSQSGAESPTPSEPATEECPINGKMLGKSLREKWEKRRPMGVMIENTKDARPQSGINSADVTYEAVAEGGITRFLNIFYCQDAKYMGPIRSARVHFINFLKDYGEHPLYAHVGGANCDPETGSGCANGAKADARGLIRKLGWANYNDMDQFGVPYPYYYRDYDRLPGVATEHTVYANSSKLWDYAASKRNLTNVDEDGVPWNDTFKPWKFKDEAPVSSRGTVNSISFGFWTNNLSSDYTVQWKYDAAADTYLRFNGGQPHMDKNSNKQLEAKNVVVMFADEAPANDGYDGGHIIYDLTGTGEALIFQDGKSIKGSWKVSDTSRMRYFDDAGKEISFTRGKIFIALLPTGNEVQYGQPATGASNTGGSAPKVTKAAATQEDSTEE